MVLVAEGEVAVQLFHLRTIRREHWCYASKAEQ